MSSNGKYVQKITDNQSKLPYAPPRLRTVDLKAEETLAIGCKGPGITSGAFAQTSGCGLPAAPCSNTGS